MCTSLMLLFETMLCGVPPNFNIHKEWRFSQPWISFNFLQPLKSNSYNPLHFDKLGTFSNETQFLASRLVSFWGSCGIIFSFLQLLKLILSRLGGSCGSVWRFLQLYKQIWVRMGGKSWIMYKFTQLDKNNKFSTLWESFGSTFSFLQESKPIDSRLNKWQRVFGSFLSFEQKPKSKSFSLTNSPMEECTFTKFSHPLNDSLWRFWAPLKFGVFVRYLEKLRFRYSKHEKHCKNYYLINNIILL